MQSLSRPALVTDSMSSGGEVHSSLGQSAPGSRPITPMPDPALLQDLPLPVDSNTVPIAVSDEASRIPAGHPSGKGGQFVQVSRDDASGAWRLTPGAG